MSNFTTEKYKGVPDALKYEDRWMAWKSGRKIPVDPNTGANGSSSDPNKWSNYSSALRFGAQARRSDLGGLGFALGDGWCGLDIDHCAENCQWTSNDAKELVESLEGKGYAEWSQSGTGVHVIFFSNAPEGHTTRRKLPDGTDLEFYSDGRYFTVSGNTEGFEHFDVNKASEDVVDELCQKYFKKGPVVPSGAVNRTVRHNMMTFDITSAAEAYVRKIIESESIASGGRNSKLFNISGNVAKKVDFDIDKTLEFMREINQKCVLPPVDDVELYRIVLNSITKGTRRYDTPLETYHNPNVFTDTPVADTWEELHTNDDDFDIMEFIKSGDDSKLPIEELEGLGGFIGGYMKNARSQQSSYMPSVSFGAALTILATALTGRIRTRSTVPNLFCVGLAPTGAGKEYHLKQTENYLTECGLKHRVGPRRINSGQGAVTVAAKSPCMAFLLDEVQDKLGSPDNKPDPRKDELRSVLKEMFSMGGGTYRPTAYADADKNVTIDHCAPSILGLGTPEAFFDNFPLSAVSDGFLGRLLVFQDELKYISEPNDSEYESGCLIDQTLLQWLKLWGIGDRTEFEDSGAQDREEIYYEWEDGINLAMKEYGRKIIERHAKERTPTGDMWIRMGDRVSKMALLFAANEFGPDGTRKICWRHYELAKKIYKALNYQIESRMGHVTDDDIVRDLDKVYQFLDKEKNRNGCPISAICNRTRMNSNRVTKAVKEGLTTGRLHVHPKLRKGGVEAYQTDTWQWEDERQEIES